MTDTAALPYKYHDLPDQSTIRILDLAAGKDGDPLSGTLSSVAIADKVSYECLSYAWGDLARTDMILIEGTNPLPLTSSLSAALRQIRRPDSARRLWVDAICINQEDTDERAWQVLLMSNIFASAQCVICWLGEESEIDDGLNTVGLIRAIGRADFTSLPATQVTPAFMASQGLPEHNNPKWFALRRFFERPWFRRAWVVQEFQLAKLAVFQCGSLEIEATTIVNGVEKLNEYTLLDWGTYGENSSDLNSNATLSIMAFQAVLMTKQTGNMVGNVMNIVRSFATRDESSQRELFEGSWGKPETFGGAVPALVQSIRANPESAEFMLSFYEGLLTGLFQSLGIENEVNYQHLLGIITFIHRNTIATDPRDKLYAFLAMSADKDEPDLRPSYTESVRDVFIRYTKFFLTKSDPRVSRMILLQAGDSAITEKSPQYLPSWVPDWSSVSLSERDALFPGGSFDFGFHVAGDSPMQIRYEPSPPTIHVKGKSIGTITRLITAPFDKYQIIPDSATFIDLVQKYFKSVDEMILNRSTPYPFLEPDETMLDVQWRTMIANIGIRPFKAEPYLGEMYKSTRVMLQKVDIDTVEGAGELLAAANEWCRRWISCSAFRLCELSNSLVGLVPRQSEIGDEVCLVYGTNMPLVIYGSGAGDSRRLLGACYIHGVMDGQIVGLEAYPDTEFSLV